MRTSTPGIFDNIVSISSLPEEGYPRFLSSKTGTCNYLLTLLWGMVMMLRSMSTGIGVGTEKLVDRAAGEAGLRPFVGLGLDNTFIYEGPKRKVGRFPSL